ASWAGLRPEARELRQAAPRSGSARRSRLPRRVALGRRLFVVEQEIGDEGVGLAFPTEGRGLAVARHELDVVAQRPQAAPDRVKQLIVVAARKVGAANRAPEQHVAHEGDLRGFVHEHHMTRRMAGAMDYVEGKIAEAYSVAVLQPAVGHERLVGREIVLAP